MNIMHAMEINYFLVQIMQIICKKNDSKRVDKWQTKTVARESKSMRKKKAKFWKLLVLGKVKGQDNWEVHWSQESTLITADISAHIEAAENNTEEATDEKGGKTCIVLQT